MLMILLVMWGMPLLIQDINLTNLTITTLIGITYGIWFTKKKKNIKKNKFLNFKKFR